MTLLYTLLLVIRPLCQARGNDVSCPGLGKRWGTRTVQTRQTTHPHSRSPRARLPDGGLRLAVRRHRTGVTVFLTQRLGAASRGPAAPAPAP